MLLLRNLCGRIHKFHIQYCFQNGKNLIFYLLFWFPSRWAVTLCLFPIIFFSESMELIDFSTWLMLVFILFFFYLKKLIFELYKNRFWVIKIYFRIIKIDFLIIRINFWIIKINFWIIKITFWIIKSIFELWKSIFEL